MIERKVSVRVSVGADNSQLDSAFSRSTTRIGETQQSVSSLQKQLNGMGGDGASAFGSIDRSVTYLGKKLDGLRTPDVGFKFAARDVDRMSKTLASTYAAQNSTVFDLSEPVKDAEKIARTLSDVGRHGELKALFQSGAPGWLRALEKLDYIPGKMFQTFRMLEPGQDGAGSMPLASGRGLPQGTFGFEQPAAKGFGPGGLGFSGFDLKQDILDAQVFGPDGLRGSGKAQKQRILFQSIAEAEGRLKRNIVVAHMKPEEAGVFDMLAGLSAQGIQPPPDKTKQLYKRAAEAAKIREDATRKAAFSGRRVFAGAGFGALALATGAIPESLGGGLINEALGGATLGAGIGSMVAPGVGTAIGAAAGAFFGLMKKGLNDLLPSAQKIAQELANVANRFTAVEHAAYDTRTTGRVSSGAAETLLAPSERAFIASSTTAGGGLGTTGGEATGLSALVALRDAHRGAEAEMRRSAETLVSLLESSGVGEGAATSALAVRAEIRRFEAGTAALDAAIRAGGIEGSTRIEPPGVAGSGGDMTEMVMSALRERPMMVDLTSSAAEMLARAVADALASAPATAGVGLGGLAAAAFAGAPGGP